MDCWCFERLVSESGAVIPPGSLFCMWCICLNILNSNDIVWWLVTNTNGVLLKEWLHWTGCMFCLKAMTDGFWFSSLCNLHFFFESSSFKPFSHPLMTILAAPYPEVDVGEGIVWWARIETDHISSGQTMQPHIMLSLKQYYLIKTFPLQLLFFRFLVFSSVCV